MTTKRKDCNIWLVVAISLIIVAIDQYTKHLVLTSLQPGELIPIIPDIFNLTLTFNPGAAFGLWTGLDGWYRPAALAISIGIALFAITYFLRHQSYRTLVPRISLALILGGAAGNIIDRIRLGVVVDFLDFYWNTMHWPAFNVADSAICVGVCILVFFKPHEPAPVVAS